MKVISIAVGFTHFVLVLNVVSCHVLRQTGCPPAEDIEPCLCNSSNVTALECVNVNNVETLRTVFQNSERYTYNQVNISFSSLQYLPHDMFEKATIRSLILYNVTLIQLFDTAPEGLDGLEKLHVENTEVSRRMSWDLLENFTQLRVLNVYDNLIRTIDTTFSQYVTKNLEQLSFFSTETRRIRPGVLVDFVNLDKVAMDACQLTTLTRDIFPRPFNVRALYFNDNRITSIPQDLFTEMPNLQTLDLRNNLISMIPQSAFDGDISQIVCAWFDGNPLKCDCNLQWIISEKPEDLRGTCAAPKRLHGTNMKDLTDSDFNC